MHHMQTKESGRSVLDSLLCTMQCLFFVYETRTGREAMNGTGLTKTENAATI